MYITPLSERGGTDVVEFGLIKLLSVVHQSLEESVGEESLAAMLLLKDFLERLISLIVLLRSVLNLIQSLAKFVLLALL